ncbi:helix-turn-helix domain-containing protein [Cupriavidus sp. 2TAF22]|uniref:helix-turn-helix domain-containing protein n=1 Tax=unclassified Cupriavidus TaxID=2640874 RepID=UPI003F8F0913
MHGNVALMLDCMSKTVASSLPHAPGPTADAPDHPRLGAALAYIHQHLGEPLPLPLLADLVQLSVGRFVTVFRLTVGMTPHRYISLKRVRHAQWLLRHGHSPALTAHECGFYDQSHLTRCLKSACGMTPRQFQTASAPLPADMGRSPPMPRAQVADGNRRSIG